MDQFIKIANGKINKREDLYERTPKPFNEKIIKLNTSSQEVVFPREMSTAEELYAELDAMREEYRPFLLDVNPIDEKGVKRKKIPQFKVNGKIVKIPDYGGPTGNTQKVYETTFTLHKKANRHYRVVFSAVDYIAEVFVNNKFVGSHEGFFAPFKFDITDEVTDGKNALKVVVKNDFTYLGNERKLNGEKVQGDKLYACTGPGWDDPYLGWHHCPAGFGIFGDVYIEEGSAVVIDDIFVRTMQDYSNEVWIEAYNFGYEDVKPQFELSVFGYNFSDEVFKGLKLDVGENVYIRHGFNVFKFAFKIDNPRLWNNEKPWLYRAVVALKYGKSEQIKTRKFGVRTFSQDLKSEIKGAFFLNGEKIKLRGANTMGFEQQDVMRGDFNQLADDILLAKICNMNFLRITQRPVQEEIYDYCDMLGLMVQSDLPLFGVMRKNKFAEGVRQAEEMERLVRSHACVIVDTFINEPFADGRGEPHRHMTRPEMQSFFDACKAVVYISNPDRVVKSVDGDYDPPCDDLPDNHVYNMWYNNHAILFHKFNKGYWLPIKKDWYYGCGEFGVEGLDTVDLIKRRYPKEWIKEPFDPNDILYAQTGTNYCTFYSAGTSMADWVEKSRNYQAFAVKFMTEFFRRDPLNVSFAVHLFIDAWPDGWMKAIMDCERMPKPAYFAYRNALKPVITGFRTDRYTYFAGEQIKIENYICNDTNLKTSGKIVYCVKNSVGKTVFFGEEYISCNPCDSIYAHTVSFTVESVNSREKFKVCSYYVDDNSKSLNCVNEIEIEVFAPIKYVPNGKLKIIELKTRGEQKICGEKVKVFDMYAGGVYFVETPETGIFKDIKKDDLRWLYDKNTDMINYTANNAFTSEGFTPLIVKPKYSGVDMGREELMSFKRIGEEVVVITTINLLKENPIIALLLKDLNENICELK